MKKEIKKKWQRPVIASTLPIKKTLGVMGMNSNDFGKGSNMFTS